MFNWKLAYAENYLCLDTELKYISDIEKSGFNTIPATVPGNFEIDFMREGILPNIYYSENTLLAQKYENLHLWYYTEFEIKEANSYIRFEGIDTIADIYINGTLVKSVENMYTAHDVYADFNIGNNELVVHIKPVCIEARKYKLPSLSSAFRYTHQSLAIRKAPHMFGWDIMPRIVSGGIWKEVKILPIKPEKINELYIATNGIDLEQSTANLRVFVDVDVTGDFITDYSIRIKGVCKDSIFELERQLWNTSFQFEVKDIENCKFWWPKNYGEPNLYKTTAELLYKGEVVDTYSLDFGIRTVKLVYKNSESKEDCGDFCFEINGKRVFILGTNWVPLDAFHSNDINRLDKALELLDDIGCNMVRCWGGNVFESDAFFDYCDKHGIMVWQDFAMGCAIYPQEQAFFDAIEKESVYQIKRLRNHASLVVWCGDNECDMFYYSWSTTPIRNPNMNRITREVLKYAVETHDYARPYLPSSPFFTQKSYENLLEFEMPERHLWGPRDYFKGQYYLDAKCCFVSETGYQGFPSPMSLKKFLRNPEKIFEDNGDTTNEYLVHAASMETSSDAPYAYRIKLTYDQLITLFKGAEEGFEDLVKQSQISQAEAMKFFIERVRIGKGKRTGIIWWNLLDGWPQISDAIVDYYFTKKLAYDYIKRSQQPLCLMFDEPNDDIMTLCVSNDLPMNKSFSYKVTNVTEGVEVLNGFFSVNADSSDKITQVKIKNDEHCFYYIEWEVDGKKFSNHYFTNPLNIDYKAYKSAMEKCGYDEFEGFN